MRQDFYHIKYIGFGLIWYQKEEITNEEVHHTRTSYRSHFYRSEIQILSTYGHHRICINPTLSFLTQIISNSISVKRANSSKVGDAKPFRV